MKVSGQCCEEWVCHDGKEKDILEKIFGKDMLTEELEKDLTKKNELIAIFKGGLKSLPGKKSFSLFLWIIVGAFLTSETFNDLLICFASSFLSIQSTA